MKELKNNEINNGENNLKKTRDRAIICAAELIKITNKIMWQFHFCFSKNTFSLLYLSFIKKFIKNSNTSGTNRNIKCREIFMINLKMS